MECFYYMSHLQSSWNTVKIWFKHKLINQSMTMYQIIDMLCIIFIHELYTDLPNHRLIHILYRGCYNFKIIMTPRHSWNAVKIGFKHKLINQSINLLSMTMYQIIDMLCIIFIHELYTDLPNHRLIHILYRGCYNFKIFTFFLKKCLKDTKPETLVGFHYRTPLNACSDLKGHSKTEVVYNKSAHGNSRVRTGQRPGIYEYTPVFDGVVFSRSAVVWPIVCLFIFFYWPFCPSIKGLWLPPSNMYLLHTLFSFPSYLIRQSTNI